MTKMGDLNDENLEKIIKVLITMLVALRTIFGAKQWLFSEHGNGYQGLDHHFTGDSTCVDTAQIGYQSFLLYVGRYA